MNGQEPSSIFRPAACRDVCSGSASLPPFVLTFLRPRKGRRRLFWRFPDRGILQMFCFDVCPSWAFNKCFALTISLIASLTFCFALVSSEPRFSVSANGVGRKGARNHVAPWRRAPVVAWDFSICAYLERSLFILPTCCSMTRMVDLSEAKTELSPCASCEGSPV